MLRDLLIACVTALLVVAGYRLFAPPPASPAVRVDPADALLSPDAAAREPVAEELVARWYDVRDLVDDAVRFNQQLNGRTQFEPPAETIDASQSPYDVDRDVPGDPRRPRKTLHGSYGIFETGRALTWDEREDEMLDADIATSRLAALLLPRFQMHHQYAHETDPWTEPDNGRLLLRLRSIEHRRVEAMLAALRALPAAEAR